MHGISSPEIDLLGGSSASFDDVHVARPLATVLLVRKCDARFSVEVEVANHDDFANRGQRFEDGEEFGVDGQGFASVAVGVSGEENNGLDLK